MGQLPNGYPNFFFSLCLYYCTLTGRRCLTLQHQQLGNVKEYRCRVPGSKDCLQYRTCGETAALDRVFVCVLSPVAWSGVLLLILSLERLLKALKSLLNYGEETPEQLLLLLGRERWIAQQMHLTEVEVASMVRWSSIQA